jgi:hypothetical protein
MPTMNGRTPIILTVLVAGAFVAAMLLAQPYSWRGGADSPWSAYAEPARRFLQTALRDDTARLTELAADAAPVTWALAAARRHPDSIAPWAREASVWSGYRRGDTVEVLLQTGSSACADHPVWMRFIGDTADLKVVEAGSECFESP